MAASERARNFRVVVLYDEPVEGPDSAVEFVFKRTMRVGTQLSTVLIVPDGAIRVTITRGQDAGLEQFRVDCHFRAGVTSAESFDDSAGASAAVAFYVVTGQLSFLMRLATRAGVNYGTVQVGIFAPGDKIEDTSALWTRRAGL